MNHSLRPSTRFHLITLWILAALPGARFGVVAAELGLSPTLEPKRPSNSAGTASAEGEDIGLGGFWNRPGGIIWQDFTIQTGLNYRATYSDNVRLTYGGHESDYSHYVSPRIDIHRGFERESSNTTLDVIYQPTVLRYHQVSDLDRVYQSLNASVNHSWGDKSLQLAHEYLDSAEGSTQVGRLADQAYNTSHLVFAAPVSGKIASTTTLERQQIDSDTGTAAKNQSTERWSAISRLNAELFPRISTGFGLGGTYAQQSSAGKNYHFYTEQFLAILGYDLTGKVNLSLEGGIQTGQSADSGVSDPAVSPIVKGAITYTPRYSTEVGASVFRSSEAAQFFLGQQVTQTGFSVGAKQQFLRSFYSGLKLGFTHGSYQVLDSVLGKGGLDYDLLLVNLEVGWRINARLSSSILYQRIIRTSSSLSDHAAANQVGISIDFRY